MTRDESTEGWLPAAGGGLANVSIRKRPRMPDVGGGHEYIIYGQRISDQTVIITLNPLVRIHTLLARCNFIDLGFYARFFISGHPQLRHQP
jgi:hypothetical protein